VLVGLPWPDLSGSVTLGFGDVPEGAVPGGVFGWPVVGDDIDPVVPVGVPDWSGGVVMLEPLPTELDDDGDDDEAGTSLDGVVVELVPAAEVLPVVDVVDGFDMELSVFGVSGLLQAPSAPAAAIAAAAATNLIERCMSAPRFGV
jgi:hypothetical protein